MREKSNVGLLIVTENLPPFYGGADIAAYRYFRFSAERFRKILLLGNHRAKSITDPRVIAIKVPRLKMHRLIDFYVDFLFRFFVLLFFFFKRHRQFDVIHCFNSATSLVYAAASLGIIFRKKVFFEASLVGADDPTTILKDRSVASQVAQGTYLKKYIYRKITGHIAKSAYIVSLYNQYRVENIFEIPYFVDTQKYYPPTADDKRSLREKIKLPPDKTVICFVGGINERKGVNVLFDAYMRLRSQREDIFLVLVGSHQKYSSEFTRTLVSMIEAAGQDKVLLTGHVENSFDYLRASDLYVLPSFKEGFPISVIEALCCGLVVIGSSIPEISPVQIRHRQNGLIFSVGSSDDLYCKLAEAIGEFMDDNVFRSRACVEAQKRFDVRTVHQDYLRAYTNQLNAPA